MDEILEFIKDFRGDNLNIPEDSKDKVVEFTVNKYTNGYNFLARKMLGFRRA